MIWSLTTGFSFLLASTDDKFVLVGVKSIRYPNNNLWNWKAFDEVLFVFLYASKAFVVWATLALL